MPREIYNVFRSGAESKNLDELYAYLKRFSLSDSLHFIGSINAYLKYGTFSPEKKNIPAAIVNLVDTFFRDESERRRLFLELTRLARFLLLSQASDHKSERFESSPKNFSNAVNYVGELYDTDVEKAPSSAFEVSQMVGRMIQWQFPLQINRAQLIGRASLLFLNQYIENPGSYDYNQKLKEYFGIGAFEFIVSGIALWMMSNGLLAQGLKMEVEALKGKITDQTIETFIQLSSGTQEDYKRMIRGPEYWKSVNKLLDLYFFDPLARMPVVRVERSMTIPNPKGAYTVPQPLYLLQRASSGIFQLLADKEMEIANANNQPLRNDFRHFFGHVLYREYVLKQLQLAKPPIVLVDIDDNPDFDGKKPDYALIENDVCVLFEVKTGLLRIQARSMFDENAIRAEIQKGAFKKAIIQLNEFEKQILQNQTGDSRFNGVTKVIKVIVGYEDIFVANPMILNLLPDVYGKNGHGFQIATISDIDSIGTYLAHSQDFCSVVLEKVNSDSMTWSFLSFFADRNRDKQVENPVLKEAYDQFISKLLGKAEMI
jgi:hypothetical protein